MPNSNPLSPLQDASSGEVRPEISLVVPTFHRADLLKNLLDSLVKQTEAGRRFEVVVVDNAAQPDEATRALCLAEPYHSFALHYVNHPIPGTSEARNCGISLARADWIGFLDDDVTLPESWLERAIQTSQSAGADIFGGPYLPYYTQPKPAWFRDEYAVLSMGERPGWLPAKQYLLGGNMVWKRALAQALGGFSTRLGPHGTNYEYGEETEFQLRAVQGGVRLWYDPDLFVYHLSPARRMGLRWMIASKWLHGKAKARIFLDDFVGSDPRPAYRVVASWAKSAAADLLTIAGLVLKTPFRDRARYPSYQNFVVEAVLPRISAFSTAYHVARYYNEWRRKTHG